MNKNNKAHFVQMLPNTFVEVINSNAEIIEITSNVFADIEVFKDGSCLKIKICGLPKVKQIIYGQ